MTMGSWRRRSFDLQMDKSDLRVCFVSQIPDLEAVIHTHDAPLVPEAAKSSSGQPPPPIFGYTAAEGFTDVPFPDFSYWGHEHGRLVGGFGCSFIANKTETSLIDRGRMVDHFAVPGLLPLRSSAQAACR